MNKMKVEFLNLSQNEAFARMVASAFCVPLNPTVEELSEIKTAVSEGVTNAIIHGYEGTEGIVTLAGEIEGQAVTFTISDAGKGIADVQAAREPLYTGRPDMERSGMGFTIMETFMDSIDVHSEVGKGTVVTMRRIIGEGERDDR